MNTIETKALCISLSNLADMLTMDPFDFGGQGSNLKVTRDIFGNKLVNTSN